MFSIVAYLMSAAITVMTSIGFFLIFGVLGTGFLVPIILPLLFGRSDVTQKSGSFDSKAAV